MRLKRTKKAGISLLELLIAFLILLIAVLTMVGYTATIHRTAKESKHQALASMEARSLLERVRDNEALFIDSFAIPGYSETQAERLLDTEVQADKNEVGRMAAAQYQLNAKVRHLSQELYSVSVTASWSEDGRPRKIVLESRLVRPNH